MFGFLIVLLLAGFLVGLVFSVLALLGLHVWSANLLRSLFRFLLVLLLVGLLVCLVFAVLAPSVFAHSVGLHLCLMCVVLDP